MKPSDYIVLGIVAILVIAAIIFTHRRKKSGKCIGCGGDCGTCPYKEKKDS